MLSARCFSFGKTAFKHFSALMGTRSAHSERKVKLGDIDINIVESGAGEESVLLMPGALGSAWTDFKPQIEKLPELLPNHTVIAWDPPGYGKSRPPAREFGLDFFENDARQAMELMKVLKRPQFSILGWSDGGITAMIMAGRYPKNVQKLVIWGSNSYVTAAEAQLMEDIRDVKKWSQRMREPMEQIYGVEGFRQLWSDWVDAFVAFHKERADDICRTEVDKISAPTFIVHGKKDPMIAAEHIPYLRQHIKNNKYYEFPDGKHNIHLRYADEFNKLVTVFLLEKQA